MKRVAVRASQDIARRSFTVTWDQTSRPFFIFVYFVYFVVHHPGQRCLTVCPPRLGQHRFVFTFALRLIRADQIDCRANQTERE